MPAAHYRTAGIEWLIRLVKNLKYRYIKEGTLFQDEINQYEPYTIREAYF